MGTGADHRATVIVDTAISPYCTIDESATITWAGASITELLGWAPEDMVGRNMAEFLEPASLERAADMLVRYQTTGQSSGAWRSSGILADLIHADGSHVACDVAIATSVRTGMDGFVLQFRRRGGGRHIQEALASMAGNLPLRRVLSSVASALAVDVADARAEILWEWTGSDFAAHASSDALLVPANDVPTDPGRRPWIEAFRDDDPQWFQRGDDLPQEVERWMGEIGLSSGWVQPVTSIATGTPAAVMLIWRGGDIDRALFPSHEIDVMGELVALALEWERGRTSLRFAANHDPLTGLANRRTLLERLRTPVAPGTPGTVLFCDVDDFKPVNDEHGHASGDAVLQEIGERLRQSVRPSDLVARYGGDEFVIHCPGTTDPVVVQELTARLIEATSEPITVGALTVQVGLSVGKSTVGMGEDIDEVLAAASRDMGDVKRRRKASV
ncbi:MAG: diguanylate cyclase domain-containing protein [Acidimicrobiales bacterium]